MINLVIFFQVLYIYTTKFIHCINKFISTFQKSDNSDNSFILNLGIVVC
jgi:hypothetical protein